MEQQQLSPPAVDGSPRRRSHAFPHQPCLPASAVHAEYAPLPPPSAGCNTGGSRLAVPDD
eukprot:1158866-Pelagomonas_calceolata.AAC.3